MRDRRRTIFQHLAVFGGAVIITAAAALADSVPVMAAAARTPASGGSWSLPRALSTPRGYSDGNFSALSCTSPLNCTAVAIYATKTFVPGIFAITKKQGVWGQAVRIPTPTTPAYNSLVVSLSCASAGNCAAGGQYAVPTSPADQGFMVSEINGSWGKAQRVPGTGSTGRVLDVACPAAGNCTAAGAEGSDANTRAFLVSQRHGTWRNAFPVPGLAALTGGHDTSYVRELVCPSLGNCIATGFYGPFGGTNTDFVATETHGIWGKAQALAAGVVIHALSCRSAGNCVAAWLGPNSPGVSVITQTNGTWGKPQLVPGTPQLDQNGGGAEIRQVICPAAGQCTVLGVSFTPESDVATPFVAVQKNGIWRTFQRIAGNPSSDASLSCSTGDNCVLGTSIAVRRHIHAAFAAEVNGRWGRATLLTGVRALGTGYGSQIDAVSCPALFRCTAVGTFYGRNGYRWPLATVQR